MSGGGDALAVLVAVVLVVGLVAIIAEAASAEPPAYDGWASIPPTHPLHLIYVSGAERVIKLRDLRRADLVGLRDTFVKDSEGRLRRLQSPARRPPFSAQGLQQRQLAVAP